MNEVFSNDWKAVLRLELSKDYYRQIEAYLRREYETAQVFPPKNEIFRAFELTPFSEVKVVILGQDPYHDDGQAHGLCFSVGENVKIPRSLVNIYKELNADCSCTIPNHGNLEKWSKQGVLLLNSILTVRAHEAASHAKIGWETFTDQVIIELNKREKPVIFLLWGNFARNKKKLITYEGHIVIESAHPSPLSASRGFFGSRPFSKINDLLIKRGESPIDWQIDSTAD